MDFYGWIPFVTKVIVKGCAEQNFFYFLGSFLKQHVLCLCVLFFKEVWNSIGLPQDATNFLIDVQAILV